jgi:hypothetical protein
MAIKPLTEYKWALSSSALKTQPTDVIQNYGWTTSNGLISGTPEKPVLQYENGWRNNVYQWLSYLEQKTDETIPVPVAGQVANYFLKTDGASNFSWSPFREVPANSTDGFFLRMISPTTYGWDSVITSGQITATYVLGSGSALLSTFPGSDKIYWYRIGNMVFFCCRLVMNTKSASGGTLSINGLPFPAAVNTSVAIATDYTEFTIDYGYQARIRAGSSAIEIVDFQDGEINQNVGDMLVTTGNTTLINFSRTSNIATYNVNFSHNYPVGGGVTISGITLDTSFNGDFLIKDSATPSFSVPQIGPNVSLTTSGGTSRRTTCIWLSGNYLV